MKNKVVILGSGFSSRLCLARSLGQLGYEVSLIVVEQIHSKPIDCYSKYVKHYYYTQSNDDEDKIIKILLENCKDEKQKVILIPTNDLSASVLDKNLHLLEPYFLFPNIHHQQGSITAWMNKEKQKKLAQELDLNVANSINVKIVNRTYEIPKNVNYPCFCKTREYIPGYKYTLRRCDNDEQLRSFLDDLSQKFENLTLMVEDFKIIEKEYAVVGFSDGNEVVIPGVIEIAAMAKGSDKGVALQGKVVPRSSYENLLKKFEAFVRKIGFVGLFDIDFYRSEGLYFFGELNLRIGGSGFAIIKSGINLPEMLVRNLMGKSLEGMKKEITTQSTYTNERICIENWYAGFLTHREFFSIFRCRGISALSCKQDRHPEFIFWMKAIKKLFLPRKKGIESYIEKKSNR
jgi:predicted ATP-grasp superfamily ATP-dependent carboligase